MSGTSDHENNPRLRRYTFFGFPKGAPRSSAGGNRVCKAEKTRFSWDSPHRPRGRWQVRGTWWVGWQNTSHQPRLRAERLRRFGETAWQRRRLRKPVASLSPDRTRLETEARDVCASPRWQRPEHAQGLSRRCSRSAGGRTFPGGPGRDLKRWEGSPPTPRDHQRPQHRPCQTQCGNLMRFQPDYQAPDFMILKFARKKKFPSTAKKTLKENNICNAA